VAKVTFKGEIRRKTDVAKKDCWCNVCFNVIVKGEKHNNVAFKRKGIRYGGPVCLKCAFGQVAAIYRLINVFGF
jgi:hypothetical protein